MPPEPRRHGVARDVGALLEALAAPFGTYEGAAVCRAVPGAASLRALAADLLCAVGRTEALTRRRRPGTELAERWLAACGVRTLFVTGADALRPGVWRELCALGDRVGCDVVFVSADPPRWVAELAGIVHHHAGTYLRVDPDAAPVKPPVGAALPDVAFPALPAAYAELLEAEHAARAQAVYDDCLAAALGALPYDRLLDQADMEAAFRASLARAPDLGAVALAAHALRAAGLLRGYDVRVEASEYEGVTFDDLLTADRLDQLCRLVSAAEAAAGVLAGLAGTWDARSVVAAEGYWVEKGGHRHRLAARLAAVLRAWLAESPEDPLRPGGAPARPHDPRRGQLWRTPPPERLAVTWRIITCRSLRLIANPPMGWAEPPRPRRSRGLPRSAAGR